MAVESFRRGVHRFVRRRCGPNVAQRRQRIVGADQGSEPGHLVDDDLERRSGVGPECERLGVFADAGFLGRRCAAGRMPLDHGTFGGVTHDIARTATTAVRTSPDLMPLSSV